VIDRFNRQLYEHQVYIRQHLQDLPAITNWHWTSDFTDLRGPPSRAKGQPREQVFSDA
jgi:xylulose-5-phosphate/fructose-6-phosphate phosphoketolase